MLSNEFKDNLYKGTFMKRKNWNGKGQFVFLRDPNVVPIVTVDEQLFKASGASHPACDECICIAPSLMLRNVKGEFNTWVPSVSDLLADDWEVYGEASAKVVTELERLKILIESLKNHNDNICNPWDEVWSLIVYITEQQARKIDRLEKAQVEHEKDIKQLKAIQFAYSPFTTTTPNMRLLHSPFVYAGESGI